MLPEDTNRKEPGCDLERLFNNFKKQDNCSKKIMLKRLVGSFFRRLEFNKSILTISLFLILSILIHAVLIEAIYHMATTNNIEKEKMDKAVFKIKTPGDETVKKKTSVLPKKAKERMSEKRAEIIKPAKTKIRPKAANLSTKELEALGKRYISAVREGRFPALTISYNKPFTYLKEMYAIGAVTVLHDSISSRTYKIDLFSDAVKPFVKDDFKGFSFFKRIIDDRPLDVKIKHAASMIGTSAKLLELLLLVPMSVEKRWIGHQITLFNDKNLKISEIETVEATFRNRKLKITRVRLKNGRSIRMTDKYGI
ncbi:MAG TPA: hypothetical protein ENG83_05825 [Nitrospirae bacterium]|nr:hypothetical protein BMS3Abin06_01896 [bacterium BMS3Abin06]HDH11701.1 hypothetical protein [Nitrospirota bacterium]HDZ03203.1 hypothetical protein [Nitrospirota bacterium]